MRHYAQCHGGLRHDAKCRIQFNRMSTGNSKCEFNSSLKQLAQATQLNINAAEPAQFYS